MPGGSGTRWGPEPNVTISHGSTGAKDDSSAETTASAARKMVARSGEGFDMMPSPPGVRPLAYHVLCPCGPASIWSDCEGLRKSRRCVADRLDVVAVGIEHESAVVVGVIVRPQPRRAVVLATGGERRAMEGVDRGAVLGGDGDVEDASQTSFAADPEIGLAVGPEARRRRLALGMLAADLHDQAVAERRQCFQIERLRALVVGDGKADVVDHPRLLVIRSLVPGRSWLIDSAVVPVEGVDADHALGAVEQRSEPAARGLVGKFLHAIADRHRGVAHDVDALLDLEDLVGTRIGRGEEFHLAAAFARRRALVFEVHLQAL